MSFVPLRTPTAAPTPTKPPAIAATTSTTFVGAFAATRTLLPAWSVTWSDVYAHVCVLRIVTETLPVTPTMPPPAPATTVTALSLLSAVMLMSLRALIFVWSPTYASVLRSTSRTPTGTATPAVRPIASVAAIPSW